MTIDESFIGKHVVWKDMAIVETSVLKLRYSGSVKLLMTLKEWQEMMDR